MESSKVLGGAEECHSCESGWTMYIGSPNDDDDGHSDDGDYEDGDDGGCANMNANHGDDSDDSMASDASSGPSHFCGNGEACHGIAHFKQNEEHDDDDGKRGSDKKAKRRIMEKQKAEMRRKEEKEEAMFMAKRASTPAQSDSKVRKNVWNLGKRK